MDEVDDVDDLDLKNESPVTDLGGHTYPSKWSRGYVVESVDPDDPDSVVADGSSSLMRVTVFVYENGNEVAHGVLLLHRPEPGD